MIAKTIILLTACVACYLAAPQERLLGGDVQTGFEFAADTENLLYSQLDLSFRCGDRYGYYADTNNNCQVFHICLPRLAEDEVTILQVDQWSFICGNGTVFDQSLQTCNHVADAIPCQESPNFYDTVEYGVLRSNN